jgi:hypothetical protein
MPVPIHAVVDDFVWGVAPGFAIAVPGVVEGVPEDQLSATTPSEYEGMASIRRS